MTDCTTIDRSKVQVLPVSRQGVAAFAVAGKDQKHRTLLRRRFGRRSIGTEFHFISYAQHRALFQGDE